MRERLVSQLQAWAERSAQCTAARSHRRCPRPPTHYSCPQQPSPQPCHTSDFCSCHQPDFCLAIPAAAGCHLPCQPPAAAAQPPHAAPHPCSTAAPAAHPPTHPLTSHSPLPAHDSHMPSLSWQSG